MKFQCPYCKTILASDDVTDGMSVACPQCGVQIECHPYVQNLSNEPSSDCSTETDSSTIRSKQGEGTMMKTRCPHCGQRYEVEDSALGTYADCQSCGKRFRVQESSASMTCNGGNERLTMTTALVFQCILLGFSFLSTLVGFADEDGEATGVLALFFLIPLILCIIFTAILHHKCWEAIPKEFARMTPGAAVGRLFIPFYNIYWVFPSIGGLGADCAMLAQSRGLKGYNSLKPLGNTLAILMCVGGGLGRIPVIGLFLTIGGFVIWLLFYQGVTKLLNSVKS